MLEIQHSKRVKPGQPKLQRKQQVLVKWGWTPLSQPVHYISPPSPPQAITAHRTQLKLTSSRKAIGWCPEVTEKEKEGGERREEEKEEEAEEEEEKEKKEKEAQEKEEGETLSSGGGRGKKGR